MGCDLVEVTAHLGARPTHQLFQGKIFSLSGKHPKYPEFRSSTGYGTGDGLCGWNCRHNFYPFFEGLSKPVGVPFTKEENDKVYRATQKQRAYERAIRQTKRELAALDASRSAASDEALNQKLDREFQRKAVTLKRREAKLAEHLRASGLLPDNSRVRVDGFGRSVSGKAVWAAKKVNTNSEKPLFLRNNLPSKYHDERNLGNYISADDLQNILSYARSLGVQIGVPDKPTGGFETYRGDVAVLREMIEDIAMQKNSAMYKKCKSKKIILMYDNVLGYPKDKFEDKSMIDIYAFAMTRGNTITLNKFMFDDSEYMKIEYEDAVMKGLFVKGSTYRNIISHEVGHIFDKKTSRLYEMAKTAVDECALKSNMSTLDYIRTNISIYAASIGRDRYGNERYFELLPELNSMLTSNPNHDIIKILKEKGVFQ